MSRLSSSHCLTAPEMHGGARMPLYMGLARRLQEGMQRGQWCADGALPSERVLAQVLDVSRETARKAMGLLCQRGLLVRVRGSGTFVAAQAVAQVPPIAPEMSSERLISHGLLPANADEQAVLNLRPGQSVWRALTRQQAAAEGGSAQSLVLRSVPLRSLPQKIACAELLPAELEAHFQTHGLGKTYRLNRVEAVSATALQAAQLGAAPGTALLHVQRLRYAPMGQVLELEQSWRLGAEAGLRLELV
jgi:GntR family transcriptional regulator